MSEASGGSKPGTSRKPRREPWSAGSPAPAASARVAPARAVAAHILLRVERGSAHSDDLLRSPRVEALSRQDRDLVTQLVLGTLRRQRVLDDQIAARLSRPEAEMHYEVIIALRLGAYQLLFLDRIPPHAAISESVELAKQADGAHAAGMVNAVLRRIARERTEATRAGFDAEAANPAWMLARWRARFGAEATTKLCAYDQAPAPTTLRLLYPDSEASLVGAGVELAPGEFLTRARRVTSGKLSGSPEGARVRLQDEASQLVAELAALRPDGEQRLEVLDACAAPGGKTAILLERLPQAQITAMDFSQTRLARMRHRLGSDERLRMVVGDAAQLPPTADWDVILCDVPCSGTGTLARNPEIRHRLNPEDFARQQQRQVAILNAALAALRPGGCLVYSTCSLEAEENEQVVEKAIRNSKDYELIPISDQLARLQRCGVITADGLARLLATSIWGRYLRTVPGLLGCDGFFAAVIVRASSRA